MTIKMYYKDTNDQFIEVTELTPIFTVHDGQAGDTKITQLYIKNDDSSKWYSDVIIRPVDLIDANPYGDIIYTETGWGVKLSSGSTEPSIGEWEDIRWGEEIEMSNIGSVSTGDTSTYYSFWFLITCPPNEDVKTKTDIELRVYYTDNAVI